MPGSTQTNRNRDAPATLTTATTEALRRAWANERSRRRIVIGTVVVTATLAIVVVVSLFASLAGESQSYRDGYAAGGAAYTTFGSARDTPEQACRNVASGPRGIPVHDALPQWVQGCADAFTLAASDN